MMGRLSFNVVLSVASAGIVVTTTPFAVVGIGQLVQTARTQLTGPGEVTDFLAIYSGARLLLTDPAHLYAPGAAGALERALSAGSPFDRPFSFTPLAAVLLAPLAVFDFGVAYVIWLSVGLLCLIVSTYLLAPRPKGWRYGWLLWLPMLMWFLPVQFGLVMGQTSSVALLGFALFVRCIERQRLSGLILGLSPFTWKPQLLPQLLVALGSARRWHSVLAALAVPVLVSGAVLVVTGPRLIDDYRAGSAGVWALVFSRSWYEFSGQTLLGLFQFVFGPDVLAFLLYVALAVPVTVTIALLWWPGLAPEPRRWLQFAALPIAAVILAPHALVYELTTWLAVGWLLLRYADTRPRIKPGIRALCVVGWAVGNVVTLTERDLGFPAAVLVGLAALAAIVWLFRSHEVEVRATTTPGRILHRWPGTS
jgi:hypothetical protein